LQIRQVKQISCGTKHIGLVANDGKCYTWGCGENGNDADSDLYALLLNRCAYPQLPGMLGHGHKQNVAAPLQVQAFAGQECVYISCGAYHTAVIADRRIQFVRIPATPQKLTASQSSPNLGNTGREAANPFSPAAVSYAGEGFLQRKSDRYSDMLLRPGSPLRAEEEQQVRDPVSPSQRAIDGGALGGDTLMCGSLYTFGLGKAGQLGQGDLCQSSAVPLLVSSLNESGMSVARVSCGMHHTVIVALAAYNPRIFSPVVYR
jgi:alpha-tubulin suppressor-like RCC1 family protein